MRIFNYIDRAQAHIRTHATALKVDHSSENLGKIRTEAFKLQSFGRIIKRAGAKTTDEGLMIRDLGENIKESAKFIEDSLGDFLHHIEMSVHIKNQGRVEEAELRYKIAKGDFVQHLDWIAKAYSVLQELDIESLYLKGTVRELKKISKSALNIDPNLLEDGTHELRRKLRWVIMYITYPQGLFSYFNAPTSVNSFLKLTPIERSSTLKPPISVPFPALERLSTAVYRLGQSKDSGLRANYFKNPSEINSSTPQIVKLTQNILTELQQDKHIEHIRSEIKKQL